MKKMPTLSVLIPNYNHADFLPIQLDSMINQNYSELEIIILDDKSTDNSLEIIKRYTAKYSYIKLIRNKKNMGVEYNINKLINIAGGEYIFLSAADDFVHPGFFHKSMKLLSKYPNAGLCSGLVELVGSFGENRGLRSLPIISKRPCYLPPDKVSNMLSKYGRWVAISAMIYKKSVVINEGGQYSDIGSFADNFLALIISLRYGACFIPEIFGSWRQLETGYGSSISNDWETYLEKGVITVKYMRTKYKNLFPKVYINIFLLHWIYMVSKSTVNLPRREKLIFLKKINHVLRSYNVGLTFIRQINIYISPNLPKHFYKLYFLIFYGPWKWWISGRLSILMNYKKLIIWENQKI